MISHTTKRFRKLLTELPNEIQKKAKETYTHFKKNPYHPGLYFKRVHSTKPIYSARISINYRAVGIQQGREIVWFWVGTHTDYEKLLNKLKQS
ncbi:superfamily I DNA and RNA helicase [Candidatus Scalindua japonica]|uniref:Superfamily I DNA and RNA helicase n=1 Tax=Candidatus Scalindua japonica TaxID=1284222 RepID=A0A286U033_9BACT|nr:superfamily I DNA and RNA helicase [Candidatus Scalindua japonica]